MTEVTTTAIATVEGATATASKKNNQLKAAVEKAATMAAAEVSVAAVTVLTSVAMRGGGGYGDPPRDITKMELGGRGGDLSALFLG